MSGAGTAEPDQERSSGPDQHVFDLSGGSLPLDFTNTLGSRGRERPSEHLHGYSDLVAWSRQVGIVSEAEAEDLLARAARRPAEADRVLRRAVALREATYRLFAATAGRCGPPEPADLEVLNAELAIGLAQARVVPGDDHFGWEWAPHAGALDFMLWPVARSAAELLTSEALRTVRVCAAEACAWLFVDTTRNRSRQWCDMKSCGNRAKARRHYERKRRSSQTSGRWSAARPLTAGRRPQTTRQVLPDPPEAP